MTAQNKMFLTLLSVVSILQCVSVVGNGQYLEGSHRKTFPSLAAKYGHPCSQHEVITEDGYVLTMFHLPGRSRLPVLLMHGILDSADTWIIRGYNSLSITLANQGYDVWLPNARGNRYSRRHTHLNPDKDVDFWKYSFHELGYYDLSASINRILEETGAPTVTAIAHSQGTTAFFVLGSTRPEYNEKINVMIALAPVCYLHHSPPPYSIFFRNILLIENLLTELDIHEFLGDNRTITKIYRKICSKPDLGYVVCSNGIFMFVGYDPTELEPEFFPVFTRYFPAGTSARSLVHYLQVGHRKIFAQFDGGFERNKALYNSSTPPLYDLGKVSMPIALLAAKNDFLSSLADVALLRKQLPNVVAYIVNPRPTFNHADYVWGRRMPLYLYPYIFEILQRFNVIS